MCVYVFNRCANIKTQSIRGITKHSKYELGSEIDLEESGGSAWTAIVIDKVWYLIDAQWSSKKISGEESDQWKMIDDNGTGAKERVQVKKEILYEYDEAYFLTNPEELIYSHFPKNGEAWQLLARPVSLTEFQEMAYVKAPFFKFGLELTSHRKCVLTAVDGEINIQLGLPVDDRFKFMYRLWISTQDKDKSEKFGDTELKQFVFPENYGKMMKCRIKFPAAGKYKIELFCNDKADTESSSYNFVCAYVILAETAAKDVKPFPENKSHEWGPGYDLKQAGLTPVEHMDAIIELPNCVESEIRFHADREVEVLANLHSTTKTEEDMKNFIVSRFENNQVILNMKLPEAGDYALSLYAKDRGVDDVFSHACTYLVSAPEPPSVNPTAYPEIVNGRIGPMEELYRLKMKPVSHLSAYFDAPEGGEVDITFSTSTRCTVSANLTFKLNEDTVKRENSVFIFQYKSTVTFRVRFGERGQYVLKIFGKSAEDEDTLCPCVFTYLINVSKTSESCSQFPKSKGFNEFDLEDVGFRAKSHQKGLVETADGEAEVRLDAERDVEVLAQLSSIAMTTDKMSGFIINRVENGHVILNMKLQEAGDYVVDLFVNDRGADGSFPHVSSFLVSASQAAADPTPFPYIQNGRLGATEQLHSLGMKPVSHPSAHFNAPQSGEVDIIFSTSKPCSFITDLKLKRNNETVEQELENMVFTTQTGEAATFHTRFPEAGKYVLKIYGKLSADDEKFPCVFTYFINVTDPMRKCKQFPKSFSLRTKECELLAPMNGQLTANEIIPFVVKAAGAFDVAAITAAGDWTFLKRNDDDIWRAEVNTGDVADKLTLSAKMVESGNSYSTLAIFQVDATGTLISFQYSYFVI